MAIVTTTNVFDFMGTESDVRTSYNAALAIIIDEVENEFEELTGRKLVTTTYADVYFQDGLNCTIHLDKLYLKGIYRDTYSITSLTEEGTALTQVAAYDDGNDFVYDATKGLLTRVDGLWSIDVYGIKISGKTGLVDSSAAPLGDTKKIITEMAAAKSGLWKINVTTEEGTITTTKITINPDTKKAMRKYIIRDL
jgi:hypothetical protein